MRTCSLVDADNNGNDDDNEDDCNDDSDDDFELAEELWTH